MDLITIINLTLWTVGIILHVIGICVVVRQREPTNQDVILLNLSITEIGIIISNFAFTINGNNADQLLDLTKCSWNIILFMLVLTVAELWITMIVLLCDRVICIIFPITHKHYLQIHKVKFIILSSWALSLCLAVLYACNIIPSYPVKVYVKYICIYKSVYAMMSFIAYVLVISKIRMLQRKRKRSDITTNTQMKRYHLVPALIIVVYIVSFASPYCLTICRPTFLPYILTPISIGFILDAIIYILLNKKYRDVLSSILSRKTNMDQDEQCDGSEEDNSTCGQYEEEQTPTIT